MKEDIQKVIENIDQEKWNGLITIEGKYYYLQGICEKLNINDSCLYFNISDEEFGIEDVDSYHIKIFKKQKFLMNFVEKLNRK